jgi:hypothetical protein
MGLSFTTTFTSPANAVVLSAITAIAVKIAFFILFSSVRYIIDVLITYMCVAYLYVSCFIYTLENFSIVKVFQTFQNTLTATWGFAPYPTLLLKKEGRKLFYRLRRF